MQNGLDISIKRTKYGYYDYEYDGEMTSPSTKVWEWFGVYRDIPSYNEDDVADLVYRCISMNDREGKTFTEIADWIEANVEVYDAE